MSFVQLRIHPGVTLGKTDEELSKDELQQFYNGIKEIVSKSDGDYTVGFEKLNKYGEPTRHHFHVCYELSDTVKKNTLMKTIKRVFTGLGLPQFKGNSMYALQVLPEPNDWERWIRYPLKEKSIPSLCKLDEGELDRLTLLAKDEHKRAMESNVAQREKMREKNSFYDKLEEHLLKDKVQYKTHKEIFIAMCKYYAEQTSPRKGLNPVTISSYANLFMVTHKLMTYDHFYDINHRK